jgi:hypothetical protein
MIAISQATRPPKQLNSSPVPWPPRPVDPTMLTLSEREKLRRETREAAAWLRQEMAREKD